MLIGDISGSDPVNNFFKAVEAARRRTSAAAQSSGTAFSSVPINKARQNSNAVSVQAFQPYGYKSGNGFVSASKPVQTPNAAPKRILGNFFDAYA
jgi:hypothetical protein